MWKHNGIVLMLAMLMSIMPVISYAVDTSKIPSQEEIMNWLDEFCLPDNRRPGEPGDNSGVDFIAGKFTKFGLEKVSKERVDITLWRADTWSLAVNTADGMMEIPSFYTLNTGFTPEGGITAPMVYLGTGSAENFSTTDVRGKIAVIDMEFVTLPILPLMLLKGYYLYDPANTFTWWWNQPAIWVRKNWNVDKPEKHNAYELARQNGARAVVWILRDQPTNINSHYGPYDGVMKDLPSLYIGKYDGRNLKEILTTHVPVEGTLTLSGTKTPGFMYNIHGILPGKSSEIILISSHHDSPFKGYVEDGSGISMMLSIAKYFSQIPAGQRQKTLVFFASAGHFYGSKGIVEWLAHHKEDIVANTVLNLNIEHVAAKEFIEGKNGKFIDTGHPQLGGIFIDRNNTIKEAIREAVIDNNLERSAIIAIDALGKDPPGEGRFTHREGIPVIHYISGPGYLLVDADTRDKINNDFLVPAAKTFVEIVEKLSTKSRHDLLPMMQED